MARRGGLIMVMAREMARAERHAVAERRRAEQANARAVREYERLAKLQAKYERESYLEGRQAEVDALNEGL